MNQQQAEIEQAAIRLLAVREHTVRQLRKKLQAREFEAADIDQVVDYLKQQNMLSDERFTDQYIALRKRKGYGPVRIAMELRERGVAENLIELHDDLQSDDWLEIMDEALQKKFGGAGALNFNERAKRARFLEYRGFPSCLIRQRLFDAE